MNFSGKYQLQSQENFEAFMKAVGLSDDLIEKGKDIKGVSEIVQNGKHFKLTITTGSKVIQNEFTLGEECELETMTGEKVKTVVQMEGDNKLVTTFKGIKCTSELNGDTITNAVFYGVTEGRLLPKGSIITQIQWETFLNCGDCESQP